MASQWLRLWHDMPNDPKWRTIARVSKQPVSLVLAVYVHVLVNASNATERGRTQNLNSEDIASALDADTEQVDAVLAAMEGRVLDGDLVSGWEKRQPAREDGAAERAKAWREARKAKSERSANATERTPNAEERPDTDTDTDTELKPKLANASSSAKLPTTNPTEPENQNPGQPEKSDAGQPEDPENSCGQEIPNVPHSEIVAAYNEILATQGLVAVKPKLWAGSERAAALRVRWREDPGRQTVDYWRRFFGYVAQSDFLMGRAKTERPWRADLGWLLKRENFAKVCEGKYHS